MLKFKCSNWYIMFAVTVAVIFPPTTIRSPEANYPSLIRVYVCVSNVHVIVGNISFKAIHSQCKMHLNTLSRCMKIELSHACVLMSGKYKETSRKGRQGEGDGFRSLSGEWGVQYKIATERWKNVCQFDWCLGTKWTSE